MKNFTKALILTSCCCFLPLAAQSLAITTTSLPAATAGAAYEAQIHTTGGTPPLEFSVSPSLPDGISLDSSNGSLSASAVTAAPGLYSFTIQVAETTGTDPTSASQPSASKYSPPW